MADKRIFDVFVCQCTELGHQFVIEFYDDSDAFLSTVKTDDLNWIMGVTLSVHLCHYFGFWKRMWLAIRYVFGQTRSYDAYDCIEIRHDDLERLAMIFQNAANYIADKKRDPSLADGSMEAAK